MIKKLTAAAFVAALITVSAPAFAAWQQDIQSAINSGNTTKIDQILASNPQDQGAIALFLMEQAQKDLAKNPDLAAKLFVAAGPFANQIRDPNNHKAADVLLDVVNRAKDGGFQQKNCVGALTILGQALSMSGLPNISSVAPNLHAITLAASNDSLESKPQCDTKTLQDEVDLAEQPGTPPSVGSLGALTPSAD